MCIRDRTDIDTDRHRYRHRQRDRDTKKQTQRHPDRQTDRKRHTDTQTQTHRETREYIIKQGVGGGGGEIKQNPHDPHHTQNSRKANVASGVVTTAPSG